MKRKKCQATRREELFYYVTSGSNVTRDVHWCVTVDYQQIENGNTTNQIHWFPIDYGKFILKADKPREMLVEHEKNGVVYEIFECFTNIPSGLSPSIS